MSDADVIGGGGCPDTFNDLLIGAGKSVSWKFFILLFVVFILLSTDVFENKVLSKFSGAVSDGTKTFWGTTITGLMLVLVCIIVDAALKLNIV